MADPHNDLQDTLLANMLKPVEKNAPYILYSLRSEVGRICPGVELNVPALRLALKYYLTFYVSDEGVYQAPFAVAIGSYQDNPDISTLLKKTASLAGFDDIVTGNEVSQEAGGLLASILTIYNVIIEEKMRLTPDQIRQLQTFIIDGDYINDPSCKIMTDMMIEISDWLYDAVLGIQVDVIARDLDAEKQLAKWSQKAIDHMAQADLCCVVSWANVKLLGQMPTTTHILCAHKAGKILYTPSHKGETPSRPRITRDQAKCSPDRAPGEIYSIELDPLYHDVYDLTVKNGKISEAMLMSVFSMGKTKARLYLDWLEQRGLIDSQIDDSPRKLTASWAKAYL